MSITDEWPVVREGVWLYGSSSPVAVRVLLSAETWGTGDFEDDESVRENQPIHALRFSFFVRHPSVFHPALFDTPLTTSILSVDKALTLNRRTRGAERPIAAESA